MAGLDQVLTRRPRRRLPLPSQRAPSPVSSRLMVRAASRSSSPRRRRAVSRSSSGATSAGEPLRRPPGWTTRTSSPSKYSTQVPRSVRAEVVGRPGRVPASRMMASSLELEGVLSPCGYHRQPPPSLSSRPDDDAVVDLGDARRGPGGPLRLLLLGPRAHGSLEDDLVAVHLDLDPFGVGVGATHQRSIDPALQLAGGGLDPRPDGDQVADPSDTRQAADNPLGLTLL